MRIIASDAAPKAIGPYSQAIATDLLVFTAGQVALDPKSGELIGRTTAEQTEQVFANLKAVLSAAGTSLVHVVKTTVYLADMADFAQMNEGYAKHFGPHKPARSTVQAAGLPKGARVGIDVSAGTHSPGGDRGGRLGHSMSTARGRLPRARPSSFPGPGPRAGPSCGGRRARRGSPSRGAPATESVPPAASAPASKTVPPACGVPSATAISTSAGRI